HPGARRDASRDPWLVGHVDGHARLRAGHHRPDAVRVVAGPGQGGPRSPTERSRAVLAVEERSNNWASFRQAVFGHLLNRLGPGGKYWDVSGGKQPLVGVSERPATPQRPYTVLSTVGMSAQRMPVIEQAGDGAGPPRIELALATTMPSAEAARIFLWLAQYPWREVTWLGAGHSIPWYHEPNTFPLGGGNAAILLLDDPGQLIGPDVPVLDGFSMAGGPVRWL